MRALKLAAVLLFLVLFYGACYVWPTPWRYDHLGATPVRWHRVTGHMQFCSFQGWQEQIVLKEGR